MLEPPFPREQPQGGGSDLRPAPGARAALGTSLSSGLDFACGTVSGWQGSWGWLRTDCPGEPAEGLGGAMGFSAREARIYFFQNHIIP